MNHKLTLKAPRQQKTNFATPFQIFVKKAMIFHKDQLPADGSHEIPCLTCYFLKRSNI